MDARYKASSPNCPCAACGGRILDRYLLFALDRYWHTGCLRCSMCRTALAEIGSSCFTRAGMILCKDDYVRLFGSAGECHGCGQPIPSTELVMRIQGSVYHVKCFACSRCRCPLVAGDKYHLWGGSVLCDKDCTRLLKRNVGGGNQLTQRRATKVSRLPSGTIKV